MSWYRIHVETRGARQTSALVSSTCHIDYLCTAGKNGSVIGILDPILPEIKRHDCKAIAQLPKSLATMCNRFHAMLLTNKQRNTETHATENSTSSTHYQGEVRVDRCSHCHQHQDSLFTANNHIFIARCYAQRGLCCRKMSVRPSVCLSHASIISKRLNVSSNFSHLQVATPF